MSEVRTKLPEGWAVANLGDIVDRLQYGFTTKPSPDLKAPRLLRITDIREDGVDWNTVPGCNISENDLAKYRLIDGDMVFARSGSIEKAFRVSNPPESVFASYLIRGRPIEKSMGSLLEHFVKTRDYLNQIGAFGSGIAIQNVNAKKLSSIRIPIPPLNEQKRIVTRIEELQLRSRRAREALEILPDLLEQLRQSFLAAALRGDLTKEWRKTNPNVEPASELLKRIRAERRKRWEEAELEKLESKGLMGERLDEEFSIRRKQYKEPTPVDAVDLPKLPETWCWASWREVGFCQNGRAFPSKHYSSEGIKLLRPGNLHISGRIEWIKENTRRMPEKWGEKHKDYIVGPGEIVINLTAQSLKDEFLGRVCITGADERCLLNQRIARLTPIQISSKFCLWLFKSPIFRHYVDTLNTGSLIQHMFTTQVKEFIFPLPPQEEQEMIVKQMNALIEKRESVLESVALSTGRLSGLDECILAKAFRGELVPQDPADEPASVLLERIREEKARMAAKQQINLKQGGMKKMGRKRRLGGSPGAVHADRRRPGEEKETSDIKREVE